MLSWPPGGRGRRRRRTLHDPGRFGDALGRPAAARPTSPDRRTSAFPASSAAGRLRRPGTQNGLKSNALGENASLHDFACPVTRPLRRKILPARPIGWHHVRMKSSKAATVNGVGSTPTSAQTLHKVAVGECLIYFTVQALDNRRRYAGRRHHRHPRPQVESREEVGERRHVRQRRVAACYRSRRGP